MDIYDTICLSGGGIKGFSFIGALDYLQNKSFIDINKITNWVGTSAGSIVSYLFTLGYTIHEIGVSLPERLRQLPPETLER